MVSSYLLIVFQKVEHKVTVPKIWSHYHWLPVKFRVHFKLRLLVHKALNDKAPEYIKDLITSLTWDFAFGSSDHSGSSICAKGAVVPVHFYGTLFPWQVPTWTLKTKNKTKQNKKSQNKNKNNNKKKPTEDIFLASIDISLTRRFYPIGTFFGILDLHSSRLWWQLPLRARYVRRNRNL